MEWNHAGKLKQVSANYGYPKFAYSPAGQRQKKEIGAFNTHYYIHDAQGNVLAVYGSSRAEVPHRFYLFERHIYGTNRLGIYYHPTDIIPSSPEPVAYTRGEKYYELSNHLGNVSSTITDRKIQTYWEGVYVPDVKSYVDYYPFGFPMEDRSWQQIAYRYGFNGQENDNEIYGVGNSTTAEFWQYDTRLGRRWNMDPKSNASISSYATFGDNPVWFIDPNGQDWYQPIDGSASIWKEGCAKTVIIDGEKYVNIGASHTVYNPYSHSYENYFQDHLISMGNKENALTRIVNDEALKIEFLGSKSTSNEDKSTILKASIHQGQNDFIRGTADLTANSLSIGGTGLTAMGTGLLAVPGLQGVGIGLIGLGNTMNTTGTLMNIGLNIIDGEWGKATVNALSLGSSIGIGKGLNNLRLTPNQASFLEGSSGTYISIFSEITNWGLDQNKKK